MVVEEMNEKYKESREFNGSVATVQTYTLNGLFEVGEICAYALSLSRIGAFSAVHAYKFWLCFLVLYIVVY